MTIEQTEVLDTGVSGGVCDDKDAAACAILGYSVGAKSASAPDVSNGVSSSGKLADKANNDAENSVPAKYRFTEESVEIDGHKLYRIEATEDITLASGNVVKAGVKGGYIESEANLSRIGNCWVDEHAIVYSEAQVLDSAYVGGRAMVAGNSLVKDSAAVQGNAQIYNGSVIYGNANVRDNAFVSDYVTVGEECSVYGNAMVVRYVRMTGRASVYEDAMLCGDVQMDGESSIHGKAHVQGHVFLTDQASVAGSVDFGPDVKPGAKNNDVLYLSGTQTLDYSPANFFMGKPSAARRNVGSRHDIGTAMMNGSLSGKPNKNVEDELDQVASKMDLAMAFGSRSYRIAEKAGMDVDAMRSSMKPSLLWPALDESDPDTGAAWSVDAYSA